MYISIKSNFQVNTYINMYLYNVYYGSDQIFLNIQYKVSVSFFNYLIANKISKVTGNFSICLQNIVL